MNDYVLAFDVGGTAIKAGIVRSDGCLEGDIHMYPSLARDSKEAILEHLAALVVAQAKRIPAGMRIRGVGLAFPGPFDYERGICQIRGLNKFEAIYGVNLKEELAARTADHPELRGRWSSAPAYAFENDAGLFALGECAFGVGRELRSALVLMLGTGLGSSFVRNGQLVKDDPAVPPQGWLYAMPYQDSMMDDYFSRRGIMRLAKEMGIEDIAEGDDDVKQLAERARSGEFLPAELFRLFGKQLKDALLPYISSFSPDAVIIGGQIARSADLFVPEHMGGVPVHISAEMSASTLKGVCRLFIN